jgi:hypothetical protein
VRRARIHCEQGGARPWRQRSCRRRTAGGGRAGVDKLRRGRRIQQAFTGAHCSAAGTPSARAVHRAHRPVPVPRLQPQRQRRGQAVHRGEWFLQPECSLRGTAHQRRCAGCRLSFYTRQCRPWPRPRGPHLAVLPPPAVHRPAQLPDLPRHLSHRTASSAPPAKASPRGSGNICSAVSLPRRRTTPAAAACASVVTAAACAPADHRPLIAAHFRLLLLCATLQARTTA